MRVVTREVDVVDPLDHRPPLVWKSPERTIVGFGEVARFALGIGPDRFEVAERAFDQWMENVDIVDEVRAPATGPVAFASFTFDNRSHGSVLIVPEVVIGCEADVTFTTTVGRSDASPFLAPAGDSERLVDRPRYAGASTPDVEYLNAVAEAIAAIDGGELHKVVLARDHAVWSKLRFDVTRVLKRLILQYPTCHVFAVDGLVGASPELLVRRINTSIESVVLAGTAPRAVDPGEDERLAKMLLNSEKDLREHQWAAASVGAVLGNLCERTTQSSEPELMELANLRHLRTRFEGTLRGDVTAVRAAGLLHPTGAVGGYPTDRAIDLIRALERMDRGRYAGPVGWMGHGGDGELAIALRCAEISGARARLFAGAGIVSGSLPESELEETRLKLAAMLDALAT